jgi:mannose-1-phosphate guanylyltransferase/mannose-6-phosphate isomerase
MTKTTSIVPVLLCGGSGTRLWPLSRAGFPKQFLALTGGKYSLFQEAYLRLQGLANEQITITKTLIVTNEEHRFLALDQLAELPVSPKDPKAPTEFLLEPLSKNTAPALTLGALEANHDGSDPILVMTPADQTIDDQVAFTKAMHAAIALAQDNAIAILGIAPTGPETGYGYIQAQTPHGKNAYAVSAFTEKPNAETATQYLREGGYYWNAGMFVLKASVWLNALAQFRGDIASMTQAAWQNRRIDHMEQSVTTQSMGTHPQQTNARSVTFIRPDKALFEKVPAESIDYAVMEHCPGSNIPIAMVPLLAGWNDLGAWEAVWQVAKQTSDGNASVGDVLTTQTKDTLVIANHRLVTTVGVDNLIVVETADAVLVADKSKSQEVKAIVQQLEAARREEKNLHRKVHRPWGWYDSVEEGERFKVKRIQVKPGASLSLQMHHHRAEHWIVVKGTAEITNGDQVITLTENQSTFIPQGQKHRLANPGTAPLEIIEVQSGSYLGEDDIVRFEDHYGRTK